MSRRSRAATRLSIPPTYQQDFGIVGEPTASTHRVVVGWFGCAQQEGSGGALCERSGDSVRCAVHVDELPEGLCVDCGGQPVERRERCASCNEPAIHGHNAYFYTGCRCPICSETASLSALLITGVVLVCWLVRSNLRWVTSQLGQYNTGSSDSATQASNRRFKRRNSPRRDSAALPDHPTESDGTC